MGMTSKERLITALKGKIPDRVPCSPNIIRWIRYHYGCTCPRHQLKAAEDFGFDLLINYGIYTCQSVSNDYVYSPGGGYSYAVGGIYGDLPDVKIDLKIENETEKVIFRRRFQTPAGELQDVIQWSRPDMGYGDGPNPHRLEPLVKKISDLERLKYLYPLPRKDMLADISLVLADVKERALVAGMDTTHAGSWGMEALGPEGMLVASIDEPDLLKGVCRLAQDVHLRNLKVMLEQGLEVVYDSWFQCDPAGGWSPKSYQEFFLPLVRETVSLAHEYGAAYVYQSDGKMKNIIPFIVEAGVDAISGLQPPDVGDVILKEVKAKFGKKAALMGGLDPCYIFDLGTLEDVRRSARQAIVDAGAGGGYILGTAEAVAPQTKAESLKMLAQVAGEFGSYT